MRFIPPVGKTGDAAYEDGNRSTGTRGDTPPGMALEGPMRELVHLITFAGLTPSGEDLQQVRKAVVAIFESLSGEGPSESYVTIGQARTRMLAYPDVQTADGRINVISPGAGIVQIPSGVTILHRGIFPISTSDFIEDDRTFETAANKTYHCYMDLSVGEDGTPHLVEVTDETYNPDLLPEGSAIFDSTRDKALLARIVTSAGNVATITNLANRDRLEDIRRLDGSAGSNNGQNEARFNFTSAINWARTPQVAWAFFGGNFNQSMAAPQDHDVLLSSLLCDRYGCGGQVTWDGRLSLALQAILRA